ncbi:hypothetical protein BC936DRAFT_145457 [Jimgerdemannia flammicorona]|uniref:Uncharacterized protein n=1 Tax=Jimgerdemannia flammicorona TaxID=994334 RepID=A0A433D9Y6_9FUNG|nr:hypothetical protein BC936DRAFT_145457 [Jimgerdemannia flammicorona]
MSDLLPFSVADEGREEPYLLSHCRRHRRWRGGRHNLPDRIHKGEVAAVKRQAGRRTGVHLTYFHRPTSAVQSTSSAPRKSSSVRPRHWKSAVRFLAAQDLRDAQGKLSGARIVLAGLGAGMTEAALIVTPSETIK